MKSIFPDLIKELPEADIPFGILHSATFRHKTYVMDVFADKDRYGVK